MQGPSRIAAVPSGTLGRILSETKERVEALRLERGSLEAAAERVPQPPSLSAALRGAGVALIAEVKRKSPSGGRINEELSVRDLVRAYIAGGASALSVLTETNHFGGSSADLQEARRYCDAPLLKKDFHIHPVQVVEARALGASGLLLIARALSLQQLRSMVAAAGDWGLEALVEVRSEAELTWALDCGATLIGINNRDLETLELDPRTSERLIPLVPADRIAIAESGMREVEDIRRAARAGADAVLIGSALSAAADPLTAVRALTGVPKSRAARPD